MHRARLRPLAAPRLGERHHVLDVQGPGAGDLLAVVVTDPGTAGQFAPGFHRRRDDGLGDEDLGAGATPVACVVARRSSA